jgi:hypothetical protein
MGDNVVRYGVRGAFAGPFSRVGERFEPVEATPAKIKRLSADDVMNFALDIAVCQGYPR